MYGYLLHAYAYLFVALFASNDLDDWTIRKKTTLPS